MIGETDYCKVYTADASRSLTNAENERINQSAYYRRTELFSLQTRETPQESPSLDEQFIEIVDNIDELLNGQSGISLQSDDIECLNYIKRECENELLRAQLKAEYLADRSMLLITAITNREGMAYDS